MSDAFTSIATTPGIADELVQDVWDLVVGTALHELPTARQFVDKKPVRPMSAGSSITMEKFEWHSDATVTAALTPLDEETDVEAVKAPVPTPVVLTPAEYGDVVVRTRKLNSRTFAPVDPYLALLVADEAGRVVDALVQNAMVAGTNVVTADGGLATALTDADVLTGTLVAREVTRLRAAQAMPWFGGFYAGLVHPHTILDLRQGTDAAGWRLPNIYGSDQSRIWKGEVGEFEGVRFVENALVRRTATGASSANVYQNYFIGRGALAEWVLQDVSVRIGPVTDRLGRFHTVGWLFDGAFKVYEDKALRRVLTGSSLGTDA